MSKPQNPSKAPPPPQIVRAAQLPRIEMIPARFYRHAPRRAAPVWIVLHATHGAEGVGKARDGALELHNQKPTTPKAEQRSPHVFIDTGEIVQCVPLTCEAWHAKQTGNMFGIGLELCGSADQTRAQWMDAASLPMLGLCAEYMRKLSEDLLIPLEVRSDDEIQRHMPGVVTHAQLSKVFHESNHYDPGPNFPLAELIAAAKS